ncbi:MAG: hypothetical protein R3C30_13965 [Hyphomonadaceae bacterium]
MTEGDRSANPAEVADYVADMAGQLAALAQAAGLSETSAALLRAQISALNDQRAAQAVSTDAA